MRRNTLSTVLIVILALTMLLATITSARAALPGDVNGDGHVDLVDLVLVAAAFGSMPGALNWNPDADLNRDGMVNIFDLVKVGLNYGPRIRASAA